MPMDKSKKRIFKNGILISMMGFYFSCGRDVFPPDSPEDPFPRAVHSAACALFPSPCPVRCVPCTFFYISLHLQQLRHENRASSRSADRIV